MTTHLGLRTGISCLMMSVAATGCRSVRDSHPSAASPRLEMRQGAIIRGPTDRRHLALIFTGHEFAEGADTILHELARHESCASFFLTGAFLTQPEFEPLVQRMQAAGHYVGPHSDTHLLYCQWDEVRTLRVTRDEFRADLLLNVAKLPWGPEQFATMPRLFLPPFEHYNAEIAAWSGMLGWTLINFTPGTRSNADYAGEADANFVSSQRILESILERERDDPHGLNGFLLLLHTGSGPARADKFHDRFGELLDALAARGYAFVRVDKLLAVSSREQRPEGSR